LEPLEACLLFNVQYNIIVIIIIAITTTATGATMAGTLTSACGAFEPGLILSVVFPTAEVFYNLKYFIGI